MFLFRKNIILVPSDYDGIDNTKGLVSFDCYDDKADGTLKTYNYFSNKPIILGIAINGKLYKFEVKPNTVKSFQFNLPISIKNSDDISCVLLDIEDDDYKIILWGSTQINIAWKSTLKMILQDEENFEKKIIQSQNIESNSSNFFEKINSENLSNENNENNKSEIQRSISTEDDELDKFIENVIELADKDEIICDTDILDQKPDNHRSDENINTSSFYDRISKQIEKIFEINQPENVLNEILPSSKFCRVEFDDGNGYYVFGIIYDEGKPKYLCYGLPAQKGDKPPKEMDSLYEWLPVDVNNMSGDGFYMMYQDATTGKNISVDII